MTATKNKFYLLAICLFSFVFFISCKKSSVAETDKNLQVCPMPSEEFMTYTITSTNYSYASPTDVFQYSNGTAPAENQTFYQHIQIRTTGADGNFTMISFGLNGIAANSDQQLSMFGVKVLLGLYDALIPQNPMYVHITEYGAIGEFIAGSFEGDFIDAQHQNDHYTATCCFRVKRTQ